MKLEGVLRAEIYPEINDKCEECRQFYKIIYNIILLYESFFKHKEFNPS
jgi:hypothetical protein